MPQFEVSLTVDPRSILYGHNVLIIEVKEPVPVPVPVPDNKTGLSRPTESLHHIGSASHTSSGTNVMKLFTAVRYKFF